VNLTPREKDKLMVALAALVAQGRLARGVKLNYPESVALITDFVLEGAREGKSVAELRSESRKLLSREQVMRGIPEMLRELQIEATFPDNTKLVSIHDPIP
jgi:urease subunit gamma